MSKFTASRSCRADYQLCLLDILYNSHFHWTALNKNQLIKMRKIIFKLRLDLIATNIFSLSLKKVLDWPGGLALNQKSIKLNPKLYFFKRRYICSKCQKNMFNLLKLFLPDININLLYNSHFHWRKCWIDPAAAHSINIIDLTAV